MNINIILLKMTISLLSSACDQKWLLLTSYLKSYLEDASVQSSMDVLPFTALESVTPATQ